MSSKKTSAGSSSADKRAFLFSLMIFIGTLIAVVLLNNRPAWLPASGVPAQRVTLEPQVIANLTEFPSAPPLTGELADQVHQIQALLHACPDYSPERRSQMQQHINWLLQPSTIPGDILMALGANPNSKLIFGMATYTLSEWGLRGKSSNSCLLPIGKRLNLMLAAAGEETFREFE